MTVLTPEREAAIIDAVEKGTPASVAARAVGIDARTVARWKLIAEDDSNTWPGTSSPVDPDTKARIVRFAQRLADAEAACFQKLTHSLYHNATTENPKSGHTDTQAADKLLSKHPKFRQDWYENKQLQVTNSGTVNHEHRAVEGMSHSELLESVPAEFRELVDDLPALPQPDELTAG
jgi:hypothetical protein